MSRLRLALVVCSLAVSCTASRPPAAATEEVVKDESLGKAWEPLPETQVAPEPVVSLPPLVDRREPFWKALQGAKGHAKADAAEAVRLAESLTGVERHAAHKEAARLALEEGAAPAEAAARAWYAACGPEELEVCRANAANALLKASRLKGAASQAVADDWVKREQCLTRSERQQKADPCLGTVGGDDVTRARAALVHALAEKGEARRQKLERVAASCASNPRCMRVREKAFKLLAHDALQANDVERAARAALKAVKVVAEGTDASERLYARDADIDEVCARLDAKSGAGACRRLERTQNGALTYRDFSKEASGAGLDADVVRKVNAHYAPLIEDCLTEQAQRLTPPDAARYELRWTVVNDGRVGLFQLLREAPSHPLAQCLSRQFSQWRYPRYDGEYQHVEQAFTVTAAVRRK